MRRAFYEVSLALFALGLGLGPSPSPSPAVGPRPAASAGAVPWPWEPGGIDYHATPFQAVPYPVETSPDPSIPAGQWLLLQPGRQGIAYVAGGKTTVVSPPQPAKLVEGTAPVHTLVVQGHTYQYDRVMTMMTTAYNGSMAMNGPWGAVSSWDGQPLRYGDVAVDPRVIPLGTYLYIDGYGPARAVDTGSAIFGDHIDLFLPEPTWQIALYGIQFHKVYILTQRPPDFSG